MSTDAAQVLSHIPNGAIVQLSGRRFPGIVIQGDTLASMFDAAKHLLGEFKRLRDEERYFETLMFVEHLQGQLLHYEETLERMGMQLPYSGSIKSRLAANDYGE